MRYLLLFLACFLFVCSSALAGGSPGHPNVSICFVSNTGTCSGAAGWQWLDNTDDVCDAQNLYSQGYGYDVSVWVDDSNGVAWQKNVDGCEWALGRAAYHVFNGVTTGYPHVNYPFGDNIAEYYPYHLEWNPNPASYFGCGTTTANTGGSSTPNGFLGQQYFAWSRDYAPNAQESGAEWGYEIGCIPSGFTMPMGSY